MKAIIFGSNGQDGFYLNELIGSFVKVIRVSRNQSDIIGDVSDYLFVENIIDQHQPEFIFHFAANSTTSHDAIWDNHNAISTGTLNILEAAHKLSKHSKIFLSGSAAQFENKDLPIDEDTPFSPLSPYAVARIHSVFLARYYRRLGLRIYIGYFFNHDSPLRSQRHINKKITEAINRIADGSDEKIELGNVFVEKEFNFAGDIMEAVWLLVNQEEVFEAVIGSGVAHSILDWIKICSEIKGIDWNKYIIKNEKFKNDYNILISNPSKIIDIGYTPKVNINQLAHMMLLTRA